MFKSVFCSQLLILFAIIFLQGFCVSSLAQENQCLGRGDPENDFYMRDLQQKMNRVRSIPGEIQALQNENRKINQDILELERKIQQTQEGNNFREQRFRESVEEHARKTDEKYASWRIATEQKVKDREELINARKNLEITDIETRNILVNNDLERRHRATLQRLIADGDKKNADAKKERDKAIQDANNLYAEALRGIQTDENESTIKALREHNETVATLYSEYMTWRDKATSLIELARIHASYDSDKRYVTILERDFAIQDTQRKSIVNSRINQTPNIIREARTQFSESRANRLRQAEQKRDADIRRAEEAFNAKMRQNNQERLTLINNEKTRFQNALSEQQNQRQTALTNAENRARNAIRRNQETFDRADISARERLAREHADINISFTEEKQNNANTVNQLQQHMAELKEKQLANIKRLTEDLPKEQESLHFISQWMNDSPLLITEAGACDGSENCEPRKPSFQISSMNIDQECINKAILGKIADSSQVECSDANSLRREAKTPPCFDRLLADYIGWSINRAIDCLSTPSNPIDSQLIYIKLANESTFRHSYSYEGGHGLVQSVQIAQNEMLGLSKSGHRTSGRRFLANLMNNSPNRHFCEKYKNIFNYEKENAIDNLHAKKIQRKLLPSEEQRLENLLKDYPEYDRRLFAQGSQFVCQFISLEEGMHRNILNGLGLYLYYKDGYIDLDGDGVNNLSAAQALHDLGITTKNPDYQRIKEYFTLAMYGRDGQGAALTVQQSKAQILTGRDKNGRVTGRKDPNQLTFEEFKRNLLDINSFQYLNEIDRTQEQLAIGTNNGERLKCATKYY